MTFAACKVKQTMDTALRTKSGIIAERSKTLKAPVASKIPHELVTHGDKRIDDYYWMKLSDEQKLAAEPDDQTKEVISHLNAENLYRTEVMEPLEPLQEKIYQEIVGKIKQNDISVPYFHNGYWYLTRFEKGSEYAIRSRKKESLEADDMLLLDENELAKPYAYYATAGRNVSPDNNILAFGEDTLSRRQYNIRFLDIHTGQYLIDVIPNTTGSLVWANDNKTVFYTKKDASLRSFQIVKHVLGEDPANDTVIFQEDDETFNAYVFKSKSNKYIVIGSWATVSQEYRYLDANHPNDELTLFQPRERNLEYGIDHINGSWYIRTNIDGAKNFKIMSCAEANTSKEQWKDLIPHEENALVENFELFEDYLVVGKRVKGITQIFVKPWNADGHFINFGEEAFFAYTSFNPEASATTLRLEYSSLTTPNTTYDYNMRTRELHMMKQMEVVGDFNSEDYMSERLMVKSRDGVEIPVSIVYKKGFKRDASSPCLLYGYGSYGASLDPTFNVARLSLIDRGFVVALAHIRGGEELGRQWYENGKLLNKKNTFFDFIDCGKYLVSNKYCAPDKLTAMGGSAGGLLMGAVVNMEPDMWKAVINAVPFVDVVTTMLDESIPLTTGEYDEWGNPNEEQYYHYMKSYSPYDNLTKSNYPAMLVTTGYHDSQVQYWEPTKYVAKMRDLKQNDTPLLLYCNMAVGHGGASGRFARYKETSMEYAFLLDILGIND